MHDGQANIRNQLKQVSGIFNFQPSDMPYMAAVLAQPSSIAILGVQTRQTQICSPLPSKIGKWQRKKQTRSYQLNHKHSRNKKQSQALRYTETHVSPTACPAVAVKFIRGLLRRCTGVIVATIAMSSSNSYTPGAA